jgi:hypothetical protein
MNIELSEEDVGRVVHCLLSVADYCNLALSAAKTDEQKTRSLEIVNKYSDLIKRFEDLLGDKYE